MKKIIVISDKVGKPEKTPKQIGKEMAVKVSKKLELSVRFDKWDDPNSKYVEASHYGCEDDRHYITGEVKGIDIYANGGLYNIYRIDLGGDNEIEIGSGVVDMLIEARNNLRQGELK